MEITDQPNPIEPVQPHELPVGFVPVPTREYRTHRKTAQVLREPGRPRIVPAVTPPPQLPFPGSRVLMWKQDPSVAGAGRPARLPARPHPRRAQGLARRHHGR